MHDFRSCNAEEGLETLYALLCRSTLLSAPPAEELAGLLAAMHSGDMLLASRRYHRLTASLLALEARRVSGDLWQDYLLYSLLERENPFSRAAARGCLDEAAHMYMGDELDVLGALSTLRGEDLVRMILERQRELQLRSRHTGDNISMLTASLWGKGDAPQRGGGRDGALSQGFSGYVPQGMQWAAWCYGKAGLRDDYAADEGLEELYAKLLAGSRWRDLLENLQSFFAAYGCGGLLRCRFFRYGAGELKPLPEEVCAPLREPILYPVQHQAMLDEALAFAGGAAPRHLLLTGGAGTGKTAAALSLPASIPALRLVAVDGTQGAEALPALVERLGEQPCRFLVLLDGADDWAGGLGAIGRSLLGFRAVPPNLLLCATAREAGAEGSGFGLRVDFPYPSTAELAGFVKALLEEEGLGLPAAEVQQACLRAQDAWEGRLGITAARRIAEELAARAR